MREKKKTLLSIIFLCLIVVVGFAAGPDTVVYITNTGTKYHTSRCPSLRNSKMDVSLGEAVSKGYEPCKRCKPPALE